MSELEVAEGVKGLKVDDVTPETLAVMSKLSFDRQKAKPLVQPIYHTSTYKVDDVNEYLDIITKVKSTKLVVLISTACAVICTMSSTSTFFFCKLTS